MRSSTRKYQRPTAWKVALVGLVAMLALLLVAAAGAQGGEGAAVQPQTSEVCKTSEVSQPRTITYTYDGAGRLVKADYGEGHVIAYTYDAAGNLIRRGPGMVGVYLPFILKGHAP